MQKVTGTLSGGAHPGSYNGQDAYNDMLVVEDGSNYIKQSIVLHEHNRRCGCGVGRNGLQRPTDSNRGGLMDNAYSIENHPNDSRMGIDPAGKGLNLSGRMGTGGNNTPMAMVAYGLEPGAAQKLNTEGRITEEVAPTIRAKMGDNQVAVAFRKTAHPQNSQQPHNSEVAERADTLNAFDNTESRTPTIAVEGNGARPSHHGDGYIESDQSYTLNTTEVHGVASMEENNYRVRRLTPLECERLQGYPDGWTDIGEWTDSKGKVRKTTDSARYKALGNSIGLPPWKWVLKRISAQYERDATMASLFDGIGGFTLLWSELNGSGSVLWASEIEDYCIAVTKKHFGDDEAGTNGNWHEYIYGRYPQKLENELNALRSEE